MIKETIGDVLKNNDKVWDISSVCTVKYKERSTGRIFEINPCIDDDFFDETYRRGFRTGAYILISGELPDKWK